MFLADAVAVVVIDDDSALIDREGHDIRLPGCLPLIQRTPPQTKPGGVLPAPDRPSWTAQSIYNEKAGPECTVTLHSGSAISVI